MYLFYLCKVRFFKRLPKVPRAILIRFMRNDDGTSLRNTVYIAFPIPFRKVFNLCNVHGARTDKLWPAMSFILTHFFPFRFHQRNEPCAWPTFDLKRFYNIMSKVGFLMTPALQKQKRDYHSPERVIVALDIALAITSDSHPTLPRVIVTP